MLRTYLRINQVGLVAAARLIPERTGKVGTAALSAFWERGSPYLPACSPRRGYVSWPVRPIFINKAFKTLARWTTQDLLRSGLTSLPCEEWRYQGGANLARLP